MPIHIKGSIGGGEGWGCNCPAFRLGEPEPLAVLRALARASVVTVRPHPDGGYVAWTTPGEEWNVARTPGGGGFCKHIAACAAEENAWLRAAFEAAEQVQEELGKLRKERKAHERRIRKLERAAVIGG